MWRQTLPFPFKLLALIFDPAWPFVLHFHFALDGKALSS
jgi:hypothetical protein